MLVEFFSSNPNIVFCFIDRTNLCSSAWSEELSKNQSDFTIGNLWTKGYTILQSQNEDQCLRRASELDFKIAVVFSTGTEFVNGTAFMENIENYLVDDFFVAGHILDRKTAYYELHQQCYVINLETYKKLDCPTIGQQCFGEHHSQIRPLRSKENIHDDYTPVWISPGHENYQYDHKCHGWNIISVALKNTLPITIFDDEIRGNKLHLYPENQKEFLKHSSYLYKKLHFCAEEFVHYDNTEQINQLYQNLEQIVTPASGLWWTSMIDKQKPVKVLFYDYNQRSLDHWRNAAPFIPNVTYEFQKVNLLIDDFDLGSLFSNRSTFINLSNIFAYEGTAAFYSLEYRLMRENKIIELIKKSLPESILNFTARAADGFLCTERFFTASDSEIVSLQDCKKPTWRVKDWV